VEGFEMENNSKSKYILTAVIIAFIMIGIIVFGVSYALKDNGNFLRNQKVNGLSFENAKVEYKNETSNFSVIVYNENDDSLDVKSIEVKLKDKDNKETTMVIDMDGALESDEGRLITATVDKDITDMKSLEYKINK
jgi:hypothetical protein